MGPVDWMSLVSALLIWLGQAAVAGLIALKRGKCFWIWSVVAALIIFPIGFIVVLIYTKDSIV